MDSQNAPTTSKPSSRQIDQQQVINDILQISLEPVMFREILDRILLYLIEYKPLELMARGAIFLLDQEQETLMLRASQGFSADHKHRCTNVRLGQCHCGSVATSGQITFFHETPPLLDESLDAQSGGHYCIPILREGETAGILSLYCKSGHVPDPRVNQMFQSVANILAAAFDRQKMDQQLIELVNDLRVSIINLREEKQFTESIIQSLNHGLLVTDLQGNIIKSNNVAREILDPFIEQLDGQSLQGVIGSHKAEHLLNQDGEKRSNRNSDVHLTTENGEEVILNLSGGFRKDARGNHVGHIVSLTDVTELRYARKEMEKMNRLSTVAEIASAVAHEVRNPLAGIKIMAQSIEEDAVGNDQQLECSRRIIRQVDRLNELLSEFFSYARPVEPKRRPTAMGSILSEIKPLINSRLMKNQVELLQDIPENLPQIIADPNQMQQVFLNLMLNSIDAIKQNGTITISSRFINGKKLATYKKRYPGLLSESHYVLVVFGDNGAGMPYDVVEKVFEPFFTTKTTGTGLGLSIVYRLLKENGAAISLESRQGKGTTFNMFFQPVN